MNKLPLANHENIVVQTADNELLLYVLETNKVYCLNETSTIIYQACDGETSFEHLKNDYQFTDDLIFLALDELKKENLISGEYESKFAGLSRRQVIRKIGLSTMIALPVIASLVVPTSVQAAISCGGTVAPGPTNMCGTTVMACETMASASCQSCSATGTPDAPGMAGVCPPGFPILCVCN